MGNKYSKTEPQFNVEKVRDNLTQVYRAVHLTFTEEQIQNYVKMLTESDISTTESITKAFVSATESLELSIYGKIQSSSTSANSGAVRNDNLDMRSERLLTIPFLQDELSNIYANVMGTQLPSNPFIGDNSPMISVEHPNHKFDLSSKIKGERLRVIFKGAKSVNYKNVNDDPHEINIKNSHYYSFNLTPIRDISSGRYGGEYVTVCLESDILKYKNTLITIDKLEKAICELENIVFGRSHLCYPDLKGRVVLLKKKLKL